MTYPYGDVRRVVGHGRNPANSSGWARKVEKTCSCRACNRGSGHSRNLEEALRSHHAIAANICRRSNEGKRGRDDERFPTVVPKQIPIGEPDFVEIDAIEVIHEIPMR